MPLHDAYVLGAVIMAFGLAIGYAAGGTYGSRHPLSRLLDEAYDQGAADECRMWEGSRDQAIWDQRTWIAEQTDELLREAEAVLTAAVEPPERRALPMAYDEDTGTWEAVTAELKAVLP